MEVSKRNVITPPEYQLAPSGKLLPDARLGICEVLIVDGQQFGKSKVHYGLLQMQPDGSWDFHTPPLHPETGLPFAFTDAERAAWNAVLDVYEERYGVVNHIAIDAVSVDAINLRTIEYVQNDKGVFDRTVRTLVVPTTDVALDALKGFLPDVIRKTTADSIGAHVAAVRAAAAKAARDVAAEAAAAEAEVAE